MSKIEINMSLTGTKTYFGYPLVSITVKFQCV